ncbi:MAG: hypothetical protein AB7I08_02265 [Thermoleophilia bacterium]
MKATKKLRLSAALLLIGGGLAAGCTDNSGAGGEQVQSFACVAGEPDCDPTTTALTRFTCPDEEGATTLLSTNPTRSADSRRLEAIRIGALLRLLAAPNQGISVVGPLPTGGYGTTLSVHTDPARPVYTEQAPDKAPNHIKEEERRGKLDSIEVAGKAACKRARDAATASALTTIDAGSAELASGSTLGAVEEPHLERILTLGDEFFRLNPGPAAKEIILSSVPLDTPLPAGGLHPNLAGARLIWIYQAGSAGGDRLLRDRAASYLATSGVSVEFIDAAYASPEAVLKLLRPSNPTP